MFKRLLLSLLIPLATLPAFARDFEYTYEGQTLTYTVLDEEAKTCETKSGYYPNEPYNRVSGKLSLPSLVSDGETQYTLVSIGESAFYSCDNLTSVTIPNSVSSIEKSAFYSCTSLTSVTIPNSVQKIGSHAFSDCNLKSVTIPNSVQKIGYEAFSECIRLTSVTIPNSVQEIGASVFSQCRNLSEIILLPVNPCSIDKDMLRSSSIKTISLIANFGEWMYRIPAEATVYTLSSLLSEAKKYGNYKVESFPHVNISDFKSGLNHVEFKIKSEYDIKIRKITFDGVEITSATSVYSVSDLKPGSTHDIDVTYDLEPWGELNKTISVTTESPKPSLSVHDATQSTVTLKVSKVDDSRVSKPIVVFNEKDYECDKDGLVTFTGLESNSKYSAVAKTTFNGETYSSGSYTFNTCSVRPEIKATEITPTTISIDPTFNNDDVIIEESFLTIQDNKYSAKQQTIVNLPVGSEIQAFLKINNESDSKTFTLPALELKTIAARATSKDCAIICAETNMSEEEYGGGFEWRRYDAPDMVPSTFSPCPVANGHLEGRLKGLSQNTYYKYRPYYEDCNGQRTFGEWTAFITADADVYFEPTVYTYAPNSVTKNSATVVGYAMGGSEDVDEQGFEYWPVVGSRAATDVKRVLATGQRMVVTLADLEPSTRYAVRAFASTRSKTTYGEEQVFETDGEPQSAIEAVTADESEVQPFDIFTLQGVCVRRNTTDLSGLRPGLYIANGRKILVH
ncbi:MAG: leucine-rich repeat domain-containing protein [Muribaculaceae bacterium]|nr:leucine-rich repeat domain-containing protein [Muribaculaceae bacterium]